MEIPALSVLKSEKGEGIWRYISLVPPIGAILISILVAFLIAWPKFNETLKLKEENKNLLELSQKLEEKAQILQELDRSKLEEQLKAAELLLPSDKDVFLLVRQIEQTAASSGILIGRVEVTPGSINKPTLKGQTTGVAETPAPSQNQQGISVDASVIQVRLSLTGDYRSLFQFLTNTFALPRTLALKDLSVTAGQNSQVSSSMLVEAYWQAIPGELASVETPVELLTDSESARLEKIHPGSVEQVVVPQVPLGRSDIFAPF